MKAIRGATKKTYTTITNVFDKEAIANDMMPLLKKRLKSYIAKEVEINMAKYKTLLNDTEGKLIKDIAASERNMIWTFLYAIGGSAVLIFGAGGYAFEKLDQKIDAKFDKLDQKIDKLDHKFDAKIDKLDQKINQILERLPK